MKFIFFLPNGIGDLLMAIPTIRLLILEKGLKDIILVLANSIQSNIMHEIFNKDLKILIRNDGKKFSQLRLLFNLFRTRNSIIVAPLASEKLINIIFFYLTFSRVYLKSKKDMANFGRVNFIGTNLNDYTGHQVNYYLNFFKLSKILNIDKEFSPNDLILFQSKENKEINAVYKIAIGISCGIRERHKIPAPIFFANVANLISNKLNVEFILFGSSDDIPLIEAFKASLLPGIVITELINLNIKNLIGDLANCDVGLVGTTGQGHMMASSGIPLVVLGGVTNPFESGPYVERAIILKHNYSCGPCYQEGFTVGCGLLNCMDSIDQNDVADSIIELLINPASGFGWLKSFDKVKPKTPNDIQISVKRILRGDLS